MAAQGKIRLNQSLVAGCQRLVMTTGVNTTLVLDDSQVGIEITWNHDFYGGFTTVSMATFSPYKPPPPPDMIRLAVIVITADQHFMAAKILVLDDQDQPVEGIVINATWTYSKVDSLKVSGTTTSDGTITFWINKALRGTYYLNVNNLSFNGYL